MIRSRIRSALSVILTASVIVLLIRTRYRNVLFGRSEKVRPAYYVETQNVQKDVSLTTKPDGKTNPTDNDATTHNEVKDSATTSKERATEAERDMQESADGDKNKESTAQTEEPVSSNKEKLEDTTKANKEHPVNLEATTTQSEDETKDASTTRKNLPHGSKRDSGVSRGKHHDMDMDAAKKLFKKAKAPAQKSRRKDTTASSIRLNKLLRSMTSRKSTAVLPVFKRL